ncbi:hypothetical protein ACFFUT_08605 [Pseudohalocynthiibacter aestuariivivens]|uniref:Uncharacterized protein n=1 Tax=Pseudohalocynthiibacter aestuariivivens TaxID=1591409 RepID=A0ABV5JEE9_9RHOB|nr:hypothetical protein [Pseudohalocynthiibacter aestuariivivens]MBS9717033.1 hypothetical protein [Pseudohalocynthiibacter aestuariivivens]
MTLPELDLEPAHARLKEFAEWTGTKPPETLVDDDGAPTNELLAYTRQQGLSLDWLFVGDVGCLVREVRRSRLENVAA